MTTQAPAQPLAGPDAAVRECRTCGSAKAAKPILAARPSECEACWAVSLEGFRAVHPLLKVRTLHRNALAAEYEVKSGETPLGRVLVFRDSMSICVRFFSCLNGESILVLDQVLETVLGAWPHEYLNVLVLPIRSREEVQSLE